MCEHCRSPCYTHTHGNVVMETPSESTPKHMHTALTHLLPTTLNIRTNCIALLGEIISFWLFHFSFIFYVLFCFLASIVRLGMTWHRMDEGINSFIRHEISLHYAFDPFFLTRALQHSLHICCHVLYFNV